MNSIERIVSLALVAGAFAACGGEVTDPAAEASTSSDEISQRTPAFVRLTRDQRRCVSPMCGGYWAQDLNRTTAAVYVSALDFSDTSFDEATQDLVRGAGDGEVVIYGRLGTLERRFNTRPLMVADAWRGLPGITARTTDRFYQVESNDPPITCITAPCNNNRARLINTGRSWSSFTGVDVRTALVNFADAAWTTQEIERRGALVAAHFEDGARLPGGRERLLVVSQAFISLSAPAEPCPLARPSRCADGEVFVWERDANRCLGPVGCVEAGVCPAFLPTCDDGYTLNTWASAPVGCPAFACDPTFTLATEPTDPTPRCHYTRCAAGYHCVNEGPDTCVPNVTCANVRCASGYRCVEENETASCVPQLTCANVLCDVGSACVEEASGPTCRERPWVAERVSLSSRNPYENNTRQAWLFTSDVTGSMQIRLQFSRFDLERGYDFVVVETADGVELARYTGALGAFTSDVFSASSLRIRFVTDASVTRTGFALDTIEVR